MVVVARGWQVMKAAYISNDTKNLADPSNAPRAAGRGWRNLQEKKKAKGLDIGTG